MIYLAVIFVICGSFSLPVRIEKWLVAVKTGFLALSLANVWASAAYSFLKTCFPTGPFCSQFCSVCTLAQAFFSLCLCSGSLCFIEADHLALEELHEARLSCLPPAEERQWQAQPATWVFPASNIPLFFTSQQYIFIIIKIIWNNNASLIFLFYINNYLLNIFIVYIYITTLIMYYNCIYLIKTKRL